MSTTYLTKHSSKYSQNSTIKKKKAPIRKWAKGMKRHFTEDLQMVNKYVERCSTSLAFREKQIKIPMRHGYSPSEELKLKR